MPNTLKELSDLITNDIKAGLKGIASDSFSSEQIQEEIKIARNYLIGLYSGKLNKDLNDLYQTVCRVDLECVDLATCNDCNPIVVNSGKQALRFKIPKLSTSFSDKAVQYIGAIDQFRNYKVYFSRAYIFNEYSQWLSKQPHIWIDLGSQKDGYVYGYLFNGGLSKYLTVTAVFEDPFLATQCDCKVTGKYPEEELFPAPDFFIQEIIDKVTGKFIQLYKANQPTIVVPNTQSPVASA